MAPVAPGVRIASLLLSLAGLGVSIYMTWEHFHGSHYLGCSAGGLVNCSTVTTSAQSYVAGVPVAVLGLIGYAVLTLLNLPWAWSARSYALHAARAALVTASMGFVVWLIAAELLIIDHICLWCTSVHVITFALFVLTALSAPAQLGLSGAPGRDAPSR